MSTLNRALAKIYGQQDAEAHLCLESTAAPTPGMADERSDGQAETAESRPQDAAQTHGGDVPDARGKSTDEAIVSRFENDDPFSDFDVSSVVELPNTTLRIDGPSSSLVEPPHFALADVNSLEPKESSLADAEAASDQEIDHSARKAISDAADDDPREQAKEITEKAADAAQQQTQPGLKTTVTLSPEWEVDRFRWPETCQRLLLEKDEAFESAIESLGNVSLKAGVIVAFIAENSGDGASTTALCIARHAAQLGRRVLLVDADVSAPKLATAVGLNTPCSWHDSVFGDVPLAESIVLSVEDRLCLMPLHDDCEQSALMLSDERVSALLNEASASNDLVILDCGSVDRLTERVDAGDHLPCDVAVIVRDASREQDGGPEKFANTLRSFGVENILFAENFVREPKPSTEILKNSAA